MSRQEVRRPFLLFPLATAAALALSFAAILPPDPPRVAAVGVDGRISFTTNRGPDNFEIFVMDGDGADPTCLTNTEDPLSNFRPDSSLDGTKIVFTRLGGGGDREIFVMGADGSNPVNLTNNAALDDEAVWSPDGTKIAFTSARDGNYDIFVMNANGDNQTRLTDSPVDDFIPRYSPDGTKITFTTNRDGNYEIYVMAAADGANPTNLTNSPAARTRNHRGRA